MLRQNFDDWIRKAEREQHIWRYTSFTKFVSVVDRKELFFPQVKMMPDMYEGFVDIPEIGRIRTQLNSPWSHGVVSCWCMSDYESDTLWGRYASGTEGVAICTTVGKLEDSITDRSQLAHISHGIVQYRNPPQPDAKPGESYGHDVNLFFKRPEFADEKEFRIIGHARDMRDAEGLNGVYVPMNLDVLFEQIYVAPGASQWFFGLVISLVKNIAPSAQILRSTIGNDPYTRKSTVSR